MGKALTILVALALVALAFFALLSGASPESEFYALTSARLFLVIVGVVVVVSLVTTLYMLFFGVLADGVVQLADVFVVPAVQAHGLGTFLVGCVAEAAAGINRLHLGTRDAHGLYAKFGFTPLSHPDRAMERLLRPLAPDL